MSKVAAGRSNHRWVSIRSPANAGALSQVQSTRDVTTVSDSQKRAKRHAPSNLFQKTVELTFEDGDAHHDDHDDLDGLLVVACRDIRELRDRRVTT
jgi:hypothetical protein